MYFKHLWVFFVCFLISSLHYLLPSTLNLESGIYSHSLNSQGKPGRIPPLPNHLASMQFFPMTASNPVPCPGSAGVAQSALSLHSRSFAMPCALVTYQTDLVLCSVQSPLGCPSSSPAQFTRMCRHLSILLAVSFSKCMPG